jgi:DivIVA domain-containing protein
MPLSPVDVRNVAFRKPPIGRRGYHEDEVDVFLDVVGAELARLIEENNDLRNQVRQLNQSRRTAPVDTARNPHPLEPSAPLVPTMRDPALPSDDHHVQAAKVLSLAQQIADRLTDEAKAEAEGMLRKARTAAELLVSDARTKAKGMVTEARTQAETMLNNAHTRAETLDRQCREKAASLERDAARKHTETITALSQETSIVEKRIDELRTFEREYRTHLKTYLNTQFRELGREFAASAQTMHNLSGTRWAPAV